MDYNTLITLPNFGVYLMALRNPGIVPTLFIIVAVCTLSALGVWQVKRMDMKDNIVLAMATGMMQPELTTLPQEITQAQYRRVRLTGQFMHDKTFFRVGGVKDEPPGFFVETPFQLEDGRVILVNRGFAPSGKENAVGGTHTIAGILRDPLTKKLFSPENKPSDNLWFYEDMATMAQAKNITLLPLIVEATGTRQSGTYPIPNTGSLRLRNDHLGYALTWFSLALIAVVMFGFYCRAPYNNIDK